MNYAEVLTDSGLRLLIAALILVGGHLLNRAVTGLVVKLVATRINDIILTKFVRSIVRTGIYLVILIAALDQLGIETTSLVAVIGAAGLAIGLALQSSLQNFAAGIMLIIFRPFKAGDFVEAAGITGVVETVSLFSTLLRTGDNREIIVPNGAVYGSSIINYSARATRRIDLIFGISYDDDIRQAKELLTRVVNADERVLKDPPPVIAVAELGTSSVDFVVRPWVASDDYWPVRFALTEQVKLAFDDAGITIPYPQQDVHIHSPQTISVK